MSRYFLNHCVPVIYTWSWPRTEPICRVAKAFSAPARRQLGEPFYIVCYAPTSLVASFCASAICYLGSYKWVSRLSFITKYFTLKHSLEIFTWNWWSRNFSYETWDHSTKHFRTCTPLDIACFFYYPDHTLPSLRGTCKKFL